MKPPIFSTITKNCFLKVTESHSALTAQVTSTDRKSLITLCSNNISKFRKMKINKKLYQESTTTRSLFNSNKKIMINKVMTNTQGNKALPNMVLKNPITSIINNYLIS